MIDATFIQKVADLATSGITAKIIDPPHEPDEVYYIQHADGKLERKVAAGPQEKRIFSNLDSLTDWGWLGKSPAAWVSLQEVKVTTKDDRYSWGSMPVGYSPQFKYLAALEKTTTPFDQRSLVMMLRTQLEGCVHPSLVMLFRNLKLVKNENQEASYQHTKSNLGRNLEASVTGAEAIPEIIDFDIPVVYDPFLPVGKKKVRVALEVVPEQARFVLHVIPMELEKARRSAEIDLYNLVKEAIVRNVRGETKTIGGEAGDNMILERFPLYSGKAE